MPFCLSIVCISILDSGPIEATLRYIGTGQAREPHTAHTAIHLYIFWLAISCMHNSYITRSKTKRKCMGNVGIFILTIASAIIAVTAVYNSIILCHLYIYLACFACFCGLSQILGRGTCFCSLLPLSLAWSARNVLHRRKQSRRAEPNASTNSTLDNQKGSWRIMLLRLMHGNILTILNHHQAMQQAKTCRVLL